MEIINKNGDSWIAKFEGENVLSLETYRKNGTPVRTPVWFIVENGSLYVHTASSTGKAKRLRRNTEVRVAPSEFRGKPRADYIDARAEIITEPKTVEEYYSRIYKKYGLMGSVTKLFQRLTRLFSRSKSHKIIIRISR